MRFAKWCVAAALVVVVVAPLRAIPAFARKYGVSCSMCHAPAPRLNAFGGAFAANGFQMFPGEPPRDTVDTNDPELLLMRGIPMAMRLDAFLQAYTEAAPADGSKIDLQTPWTIKLLSGGQIASNISYYMYFFLTERGDVAGLEDAYLQFTDVAGTGVSLMVGQFQVSDPMFKRELRLENEDYQVYRVRVGDTRADLTYDRGVMATWSPWRGGDIAVQVLNGRGLSPAGEFRLFDGDSWKTYAARLSHEFGPLRVGAFGYLGHERENDVDNKIRIWGPDLTLALGPQIELNGQFLRREDTDPSFTGSRTDTRVDALLLELVWSPQGPTGRWFLTGLYNDVRSADAVFTVRQGETGPLDEYRSLALSASHMLRRNLRLLGESQWNLGAGGARFTVGFMTAF